jgi:hypothetical protein
MLPVRNSMSRIQPARMGQPLRREIESGHLQPGIVEEARHVSLAQPISQAFAAAAQLRGKAKQQLAVLRLAVQFVNSRSAYSTAMRS